MATDHAADPAAAPIGVFDSGIGGLTVVAALRALLPAENLFYLGDTARIPYGTRSRPTVERYSVEIGGLLLAAGAKMIVVACNTASAIALPKLQRLFNVPVVGVVEPGASAATRATRNGRIGVIGTRGTVRSRAYERAIRALRPDATIVQQACPLLVPLIEEGWVEDAITDQVLRRYLDPVLREGVDTLVLACTHYPLLAPAITRAAGPEVVLVDSAHNCAEAVRHALAGSGLANTSGGGALRVALTDPADTFLRSAAESLQLDVGEVEMRAVQGVGQEG